MYEIWRGKYKLASFKSIKDCVEFSVIYDPQGSFNITIKDCNRHLCWKKYGF